MASHVNGANPDGADPKETLRQLFKKQDLDEDLLKKFTEPKASDDKALGRKIDSPSKFWKVGVSATACYKILAAFTLSGPSYTGMNKPHMLLNMGLV